MTHLTFEEISELADSGQLRSESVDSSSSAAKERHLADCESCRAALSRVRELVAAAHALPREVAPPLDVWDAVRTRVTVEARARGSHASHTSRAARWWHNGWLATAAAIVLVLGTATFMTLASRGRSAKAKAMQIAAPPVSPVLYAVDKNYVATIRELRATLDAQRSTLAPSTVRTVEHSLSVIDAAIAEARAALAADPANQYLVDILAAHYERQVDLLQRATELSSSN
jgi:anti-sigma-K factor RskA